MGDDREGPDFSCTRCLGTEFAAPIAMAFQPIISVRTSSVFAYEALVRGVHGEGAATVFAAVKSAELHAFDQSCRAVAIETAAALGLARGTAALSINFLPNAIYDPKACFLPTLQVAARHGIAPDRLIFEIAEHEAMRDPDRLALIVKANRAMGLRTALDDFGTGFCNLGLLTRFQPEIVKLDMLLLRGIDVDPVRQCLLRHCIALCRELGITLIAEGIETLAEYRTAAALGVTLMQGFLFGQPAFRALPEPIWP